MTEITISAQELALIEHVLQTYVDEHPPIDTSFQRTQLDAVIQIKEVISEWLIENGYGTLTEDNADDIVLCNEVQ